MPHLELEDEARRAGFSIVAGVDEVGRGPWAGPVFACAVVLDTTLIPREIIDAVQDSKCLPRRRRQSLAAALRATPGVFIGLGEASVDDITTLNVLGASKLAMTRALAALPLAADFALVDGPHAPAVPCPVRSVVKGDSISASIASASIVAKVARDLHMMTLAQSYPGYGWERNAGYGTAEHRAALLRLGPSAHHRPTFAPVFNMLRRAAAESPHLASPDSMQAIESVDS